jgi:hypothetical protein
MKAAEIVNVERDGLDGILVTFSDGTITGYVAEELLGLRPIRERVAIYPQPDCPDKAVRRS